MKITSLYKTLGLAIGALVLTACSSKGGVNEGNADASSTTTGYSEDARVSGQALGAEANAALLAVTTFYFGFDQSSIEEAGKPALKAHAAALAAKPSARIVLEGNTDSRGTVEYNLALGERRAVSVRNFLVANGAKANQIQVVSFGEERPAVLGDTEADYAKNRRVELKYLSK